MHTSECWLGYHESCSLPDDCDCLCHYRFGWDDADENNPSWDQYFERAADWAGGVE